MNIVYASDNGFAEYLGISMLSLFENNKECEQIVVHILDGGINQTNKNNLLSISGLYSRDIIFYDTKNIISSDVKQQRGSLSTFARLFLAQILPDDVKKAIYLDCDILVLKNLQQMYATDITGKYIAGVRDCVSFNHYTNIGLDENDVYYNAGVLLINVEEWRKDNLTDSFARFIEKFNNDIPYADQGIVNGVMSCKSKCLDLEYNAYVPLYDFSYKDLLIFRRPHKYYSEQETSNARNNPAIVHFTTSFLSLRPWIEGCEHEYADKWLEYKMKTPWADVPLKKDNRSGKKKLAVKIYKALPGFISVRIAGALHSKIVPFLKGRKKC